jgi:hypothetical protein
MTDIVRENEETTNNNFSKLLCLSIGGTQVKKRMNVVPGLQKFKIHDFEGACLGWY